MGLNPSSSPAMYTIGHSSPFDAWKVVTVTDSLFVLASSVPRGVSRLNGLEQGIENREKVSFIWLI